MVGIATKEARPNLHYDLINPVNSINYGCPPMGWRFDRKRMGKLIEEERILWPKESSGRPRQKVFLEEFKTKFTGFSSIIGEGIFTRDGTRQIDDLLGTRKFPFPKPTALVRQLLEQGCPEDGIILDSFAGSGTTGHAVEELNVETEVRRNFILVEMREDIAEDVTAKRLRAACESLGSGGFRFCTLGEPLFDAHGNVSSSVTFSDLAAHVFFCETGSPIPKKASIASPFIGTFQGRAVFLLYAADSMGVPSPKAGNVLTVDKLDGLPLPSRGFGGPRVVYAEGCTVSEDRLNLAGVTFKQIPYQIEGL